MQKELTYNDLFEPPLNYPDFDFKDRLDALVGLDDYKTRISKILGLLINPESLQKWAESYHEGASRTVGMVLRRPPLIVFEGDVGSGKTELAMTIGDAVARQQKIKIDLYPLSLSTRGVGKVGEMTQLISAAFDYTVNQAKKLKSSGDVNGGIILLIDEADALAQSRESSQMHHEDKAGVNAFIRGIDRLGNGKLPAVVIMCTNRMDALDPAIRRRAADIFTFHRPNDDQRKAVLKDPLNELGIDENGIEEFVRMTGSDETRNYGFTYSDITQRLIPSIILDAYPDGPVEFEKAKKVAQSIIPTLPFNESYAKE